MNEVEKIRAASEFLMRCDLKGHEVPYFNEVMQYLNELSEKKSAMNEE
ncbi:MULTISPECIES: hypothetical protein [Halomonadaceae]|nr:MULTISPECIES: hypothetical protein [Halomonas]